MGVIVWADLTRLVMLCLVVETNCARLGHCGLVTGSDRRLVVAVWASSRVFSTQHFLAKISNYKPVLDTSTGFLNKTRQIIQQLKVNKVNLLLSHSQLD